MDAPLLCLESTVAVEELEQVWFIVDVILPESGPSPASREQHPDAIGDGVEMEVGKFVNPERGIRYAFRGQRPLFGVSDPRHAEVGRGEDNGDHVLQMGISQESDVFEVVRLLDVSDRLLDSPSRDVSGDDLPEIGSGRRLCQSS